MGRVLMTVLLAFASIGAQIAGALPAAAQSWPDRPIRIIIPFPVGGSVDATARVFAAKLQDQLKSPVLVESRAGAAGNVAGNAVAKAPPDGYTYLMPSNSISIAPSMYKSLPFNPIDDLARVAELVTTSSVIVVNKDVPVKTFGEFVAYVKAHPGKLNYGATGVGTASQLTMEMVKHATGLELQVVPFTGDAPLFTAIMGGDVHCALVPTTTAKSHIESGDVRALAVTTAERVSTLPGVPTLMESGVSGFSVTGWLGLFTSAGTPRDLVERMARESLIAIRSDDIRESLANLSLEPANAGPAEFDRIYRDEVASFKKIIVDAHIPTMD